MLCPGQWIFDAGDTPQPGLSGCFLRACFPWLSRCHPSFQVLSRCHPSIFSPSCKPDGVSPETRQRLGWCVPKQPIEAELTVAEKHQSTPTRQVPPICWSPPVSSPMVCPRRLGWCVPGQPMEAELAVAEKPPSTPTRRVPPICWSPSVSSPMVCPRAAIGSRAHRCRKATKHSRASGATHLFFTPSFRSVVCPLVNPNAICWPGRCCGKTSLRKFGHTRPTGAPNALQPDSMASPWWADFIDQSPGTTALNPGTNARW